MQAYPQKLVECWQVPFENRSEYTVMFHVESWLFVSTHVKLNNLYKHLKIIVFKIKI